ncbi:hypothetical protein CFG65_23520 [Vibrio parahaemolyticus]|uniref:hypothetical protein n=1 Tax=Vibrio parahaemolyticus TaxID=670 RepID=UPI000C291AB9|nr:hypothetical protein [Vibrio parahaemolyticus]PJR18006.1 hypothetical protein CFG65_23520 [Vibrio parahaemolyticus]HAS6934229.1 hypothetical protein [Vibrio parahaemolyticus]
MSSKITFRDLFDLVRLYLFGTLSGKLMTIGITLLLTSIPGFWDYIMYAFDSMRGAEVTQPTPAFQWPQVIGCVLFVVGVCIKYIKYRENKCQNLREEKTKFKETYRALSNERLQDEFERLYSIKFASVKAIKNILGHEDNVNLVIALFEKAHPNVEPFGDWFKTKGRFIRLRYNVGFIVWLSFPLLAFTTLCLGVLEWFNPGITQSGQYAVYAYPVMLIAIIVGSVLVFQDLKALGHAITLVNKYQPEN